MLTPKEQEILDSELLELENKMIEFFKILNNDELAFPWHHLGVGIFTLRPQADMEAIPALKQTLIENFLTIYTIELTGMVFDLRTARFILNFEFTKRRRKLKYDPVPKEMRRQMAEADKELNATNALSRQRHKD